MFDCLMGLVHGVGPRGAGRLTWSSSTMETLSSLLIPLVENGYVPDLLVRVGVKQLLQSRLDQEAKDILSALKIKQEFIQELRGEVRSFFLPISFHRRSH